MHFNYAICHRRCQRRNNRFNFHPFDSLVGWLVADSLISDRCLFMFMINAFWFAAIMARGSGEERAEAVDNE